MPLDLVVGIDGVVDQVGHVPSHRSAKDFPNARCGLDAFPRRGSQGVGNSETASLASVIY
jgi:hypothetical protein